MPPLQPHTVNWQQYFTLEWTASQRAGAALVEGHITNTWGFPAARVQLLVEGLDASGQLVGQCVSWLGSSLQPDQRTYFEAPAPPGAPTYRVRVFAFDWVQVGPGALFP